MKRFLGLLVCAFIFNSCDDGDMKIQNISFEDVTAAKCGNIVYKLNSSEALIIEITENANAFISETTALNTPRVYTINSQNHVVYRAYYGTVTSANICGTIQPATPTVTEEWNAVSGTIQITTTPIKTTNATTHATKITGYNHYIVFKNIQFAKPNGTQLYESYVFGNYTTSPTNNLPFAFTTSLEKCTSSNLINNSIGSEAIKLNIDPTLIANVVTPLNTPRTGLISSTTNKLTYQLFNGAINTSYFCSATVPTTPTVLEEWNAIDGVANANGIIEVTTTTSGTGFLHTIHLKGVTLKKGNSDFYLGDDFLLGELLTN